MSTPRTTGSEEIIKQITLADWTKLSARFLAKLCGKRPQFWFRALKALDRKENPFIPTECIRKREKLGFAPKCETSLQQLENEGISVFPCVTQILSDVTNQFGRHPAPERKIVSVRISDMFTLEELRTISYDDILATANEKHGLEPCGLQDGLSALCEIVISRKRANANELSRLYLICVAQPFHLEDDTVDPSTKRVPVVSVFSGDNGPHGPGKQGFATLYSVGNGSQNPSQAVVQSSNTLLGPETRLIFTSTEE